MDTAPDTRSDQVYRDLKTRLLVGDFLLNVRLSEERLGAEYGVSRTPVRAALHRLDAEGLVARLADGGFGPVTPDVDVMRDLYEVRLNLELLALRRPAMTETLHDSAQLDVLRQEWRSLQQDPAQRPDPSFVLLDEAFHLGLAVAAGNEVVVDLLQGVNNRIRIVRMQDFLSVDRINATISEHLEILDALQTGNPAKAEAVMTMHIDASKSVVDERVFAAVARMAGRNGANR